MPSKSELRLSVLGLTTVFVLMVTTPAMGIVANAKHDPKPPKLNLPVTPSFVVGSSVSAAADWDVDPENGYTHDIQQSLQWSASTRCRVHGLYYDIYEIDAGFPRELIEEGYTDTTYIATNSDYDGTFGGGSSVVDGWSVVAWDACGNATGRSTGSRPEVTQENNEVAGQNPPGVIAYSGSWGTSNCTCFSGGHVRRTTSPGASAMFTGTFFAGEHVALLMAEGPGRGQAEVLIDGVEQTTIDTFASVNTNRIVVFQTAMKAGTHTLTVQNLATTGRPRIDLDAVMTN